MIQAFPASSLDNSILTSVFLGLVVVWFFQERFGWGLSGLVVPGYLASVFAIQPISGLVITAEALATYLLVLSLSETVPRWWPWTTLFGRDRFLLILLVSVGVRLSLEGKGLAYLTEFVGEGVSEDLHSMGLVVVPLAANALWRTGIRRGVIRVFFPVFLTWVILQYGLLQYTNLSLSNFELTYEDLARDFVSSPRAYMILLTGAYFGSLANLKWGWDFGGIIVPGLLALCWLEPARLVATLGEVLVLSVVFSLLLRLPALRSANLTGGRPMVLIFALGFALKYAFAWIFGSLYPGFRVGELFGFGYLLPSIMALRVVKHGEPFRSMIPGLLTSFTAFLASSVVGYGLLYLLPEQQVQEEAAATSVIAQEYAFLEAAQRAGPISGRAIPLQPGLHDLDSGALWVRPRGRDLAISASGQSLAMAESLFGATEALTPKVVHLCTDDCQAVRKQLQRRFPVLVLEHGPALTLNHQGTLPPSLDLPALHRLFGEISLEMGRPGPVLTLPRPVRIAAAARRRGTPVLSLSDEPNLIAADTRQEATNAALQTTMLDPFLHWWKTGSPQALELAAGVAWVFGFEVIGDGDRAMLNGPGLSMLASRNAAPIVIHVPQMDPPEIRGAAQAFAAASQAGILVFDATPENVDTQNERQDRLAHRAALSALHQMGPQARVISIRALRPDQAIDADLVLSGGEATGSDTSGSLLDAIGDVWDVEEYDGSQLLMGTSDRGNAVREAVAAATGTKGQTTVFISPGLMHDMAPVSDTHFMEWATQTLPRTNIDTMMLSYTAAWDHPISAAARQAHQTTRRSDVQRWQQTARRFGMTPSLGCDPFFGCRWLAASRCDGDACEGWLYPLSATDDPVPSPFGLIVHPMYARWTTP